MQTPLKTLIYGSCVSRDVVRLAPHRFELANYIARQSWVSAYSPALPSPDVSHIESPFQRRSLIGDFGSTAPRLTRRLSSTVDLLLIDIDSERHGVMPLGDGFVSLTPEHYRAFPDRHPGGGEVIPFGADEHFALFEHAATRAAAALRGEGTLERAVVLRYLFTDRLDDGGELTGERVPVATLNAQYERYYDVLADRGYRILSLPEELAISTTSHTWGPASDHFVDAAYEWWADRLHELDRTPEGALTGGVRS